MPMPIRRKWSNFRKENVREEVHNVYGVYELANEKQDIINIGEGKIRDRLRAHFADGSDPIPGASYFRYEASGGKNRAIQRYNTLLAEYKRENDSPLRFNQKISFYKIDLKLDVKKQLLDSNVDLTYYAEQDQVDSLTFLLHRNFSIQTLTSNNLAKYTFNTTEPSSFPFTPEAGTLTIYLSKPLQKGEALRINLQYAGKIGIVTQWGINRITEDWIEIGMYAPWFPYRPEIENLTYQVDVKIDPEYQVIGMGKIRKKDDRWQISQETPKSDIILMAARNIRSKEICKEDLSVKINYTAMNDSTAIDIIELGLWSLGCFRKWFGCINVDQASIVIAARNKGGGYARRGFVVLTPIEDADYYQNRIGYFQNIAHEFSHLWWSKAPSASWEDWLNESFAEYSALMAVREKFGSEPFKDLIQKKRKNSKGLPAIKGIDRMAQDAFSVLYDKGCILLHELELEIGKDAFLKLLKELTKNKVSSTDQFLEALKDLSTAKVSNKFEEELSI